MSNLLPVVLYIRKSTEEDERQAQSFESQETRGRTLAEPLGFPILVINDAHSAKEPGRPEFDKIMEGFDKGLYSGLIAWHPERAENVRRSQAKTLKNIEEELDGLMRMCARNLIDEDEFKRRKNALMTQRDKVRRDHLQADTRGEEAAQTNRTVAEFMQNAYAWMKVGNEEAKRAVAQNLGSNFLWDGDNLLPELHPLLVKPKQAHMELTAKYHEIKLDKTLSGSTKKQHLHAVRSAWSGIWEVNQTLIAEQGLRFTDVSPSANRLAEAPRLQLA